MRTPSRTFRGNIHGRGEEEWLMCYRPDDTADFVGLQRVVGRVGERSGSMVLETTRTFDGEGAKGPQRVVAGSRTGWLGTFDAPKLDEDHPGRVAPCWRSAKP